MSYGINKHHSKPVKKSILEYIRGGFNTFLNALHKLKLLPSISAKQAPSSTYKPSQSINQDIQDDLDHNYGMPPLNFYNFYRYYIPQYLNIVYTHKQVPRFILWSLLLLLQNIIYPIISFQIVEWDQAIFTMSPFASNMLPALLGALVLDRLVDMLVDIAESDFLTRLKDSVNKKLLVNSIHTKKGIDILIQDSQPNKTNPLPDIGSKYTYMSNYIENIGSLTLFAVASPFVFIPTIYAVYIYNLAIPALCTGLVSGLVCLIGTYISSNTSTYDNRIQVQQQQVRSNLEALALNGQHGRPNSLYISKQYTGYLTSNITATRSILFRIKSFIYFLSEAVRALSKPIIGILFFYTPYRLGKMSLKHYTLLTATLGAIPKACSVYMASNNGLKSVRQGAGVYNRFKDNYIAAVENKPNERLPSYYEGEVEHVHKGNRIYSVKTKIRRNNRDYAEYNIQLDDRNYLAIMGPNGCGKSTALKLLDGTHPATLATESRSTVISIAQKEALPEFVKSGCIYACLLHLWPTALAHDAHQENLTAASYVASLSHTQFRDNKDNIIDKNDLLDHATNLLLDLGYKSFKDAELLKDYLQTPGLLASGQSGGEQNLLLFAFGLTVAKFCAPNSPTLLILDELRAPLDPLKKAKITNSLSDFIKNKDNNYVSVFEVLHDHECVRDMLQHVNGKCLIYQSSSGDKAPSISCYSDYETLADTFAFSTLVSSKSNYSQPRV